MLQLIIIIVLIYLVMGLLFAIPFLWKGITKVDEGTINSKFGFKMIIMPGVIVFWPVLLRKWRKAIKSIMP